MLLAALFNLAHRDAAQGSEDALQWLDTVAPTWCDVARRRQRVAEIKSRLESRTNGRTRVTLPVTANAAKVKSGLFIAMQATGATVGKTAPTVNNVVKTYVLPMPKQVSK